MIASLRRSVGRCSVSGQKRHLLLVGTLVAVLSVASNGSVLAQSSPPPGVDLTGIWLGVRDIESPYTNTPYPSPAPFTERGRELARYWANPRTNLGARCLPGGGPAGMMNGSSFFPIEIIQRPEQVTLLFELMQQVRRIFMDGRGHPAPDEIDNTWMGHSVGRWEGATLVIDTIGVNSGVLNGSGAAVIVQDTDADPRMPYTAAMHLTERWRLIDDGEYLETALTIEDPTVYTEPLRLTRYWKRSPETPMLEYICTENPRPEDEGFGDLLRDGP